MNMRETFASSMVVSLAFGGLGCAETAENTADATEHPAQVQSDLYGNVGYGSDCSSGMQSFLNQVAQYGRIASATAAFQQCLDQSIRARYRKCNGDPFYSDTIDTQIARAYDMTHSANDVSINCSGGSGNASTSIGSYTMTGTEGLSFGGWLASVYQQLSWPVCNGSNGPNCRFAAYPWPYSQAAGIIWHEVSHQHGYTHGANDQAGALTACGYPGDPTWNFQVNTMPYIIGDCLSAVIDQSARCGTSLETCGANALKLVDGYNSSTCTCVHDPRPTGIGALGMPGGQWAVKDIEKTADGDWMGSWHLGSDNTVLGLADVNADGAQDIVIRSGWGFGAVSGRSGTMGSLAMVPWGTSVTGSSSWVLNASDTYKVAGNFDGDGRRQLVLRSSAGNLLFLGVNSANAFTTRSVLTVGSWAGAWHYGSDNVIVAAADFDGNGSEDLLVRSPWGIGILARSGGSWTSLVTIPYGNWIGDWHLGSDNQVGTVGDFDGNGRKDFVLRSSWGIALVTLSGGSFSTLSIAPNNVWFGGWHFNAVSDNIVGVADFNADRSDDLLLQSAWGIGLIYRDTSGNFQSMATNAYGDWLGYWHLGTDNTFAGVGDFDGDGWGDIYVRSPWGAGFLGLFNGIQSFWMQPYGSLLGDWWFTSHDTTLAIGDVDGDGRTDLLMRHAP